MPDIHKQNLILLPPVEYARPRTGRKVYAGNYWLSTTDGFIAFCMTPRGGVAAQCNSDKNAVEALLSLIHYPVELEVKKIDAVFVPSYDDEFYWFRMRQKYCVSALENVSAQKIADIRKNLPNDATDREIAAIVTGNEEPAGLRM